MVRNSLLVFVSVLLSLAMAEGVVRAFGLRRPLRPYQGVSTVNRNGVRCDCFGPEVTRPYFTRHGDCVAYPINNLFLRRRQWTSPKKEPGVYRIFGQGGSFAYGFGVFQEDTFMERLEEALNREEPAATGRRFEVLNGARLGTTTAGEMATYETRGQALDPDLVLFGINLSSLLEFPANFVIDPGRWGRRDESWFRLWDWLSFRWDAWAREPRRIQAMVERFTPGVHRNVAQRLGEFHQKLKSEGRSLLVLLFPIFYDLKHYAFAPVHQKLDETMNRLGIPYVDLFRDFEGEEASRFWITPFDQHPNEAAHERFYQATLKYLKGSRRISTFSS